MQSEVCCNARQGGARTSAPNSTTSKFWKFYLKMRVRLPLLFAILQLYNQLCDQLISGADSLNTSIGITNNPLKIAYCITGQLARLEILSKIKNIIIPNAKVGNIPHLFLYLDNQVDDVGQTYWNYNYSNSLYRNFDRKDMKAYIDGFSQRAGYGKVIRTRVKLEPPPRTHFQVVDGKVLVNDKEYSGHDGPKDNFESAPSRFQMNLRWMSGLRECARWVMLAEYQQGYFYDFVVRLRDDTFALGPWLIGDEYSGFITSQMMGTFHGINDHNFVVDRRWVDVFLRGIVEDYYFNSSLAGVHWGNPEHRLFQLAESHSIPMQIATVCEVPLIPLRGLVNSSYWRLHPLYLRMFPTECARIQAEMDGEPANPDGSKALTGGDSVGGPQQGAALSTVADKSKQVSASANYSASLKGERFTDSSAHASKNDISTTTTGGKGSRKGMLRGQSATDTSSHVARNRAQDESSTPANDAGRGAKSSQLMRRLAGSDSQCCPAKWLEVIQSRCAPVEYQRI